jgi:hypothetical protein
VVLLALVSGVCAIAVRSSCVGGVLFRLCASCTAGAIVIVPTLFYLNTIRVRHDLKKSIVACVKNIGVVLD